jgi:hypothetical protein
MAYQVNKTDGTIVATVADGQLDQLSTDLTLIGKNYSGFGEALNENFIKLLENFSSTTAPDHPIKGQVWFDSSENKLKVYNGITFIPVSSATISNTQPDTLSIGDLWFDNVGNQLYFFDGFTPILLGPLYSSAQGLSGLKVDSILDTLNQTKVITYLYNNGILLGIFAKDSFTPKVEIVGFSGSIQPGFNAGTLAGLKFNVTCTNSEQLGGAVATTYVRRDTSNAIDGQLRITTDLGVVVGSAGQLNLYVTAGDAYVSNASTDKNLILNVRRGISQENAILIDAANRTVDFYSDYSDSVVRTGGNLIVAGNLTVEGTTTTINTSELTIEDKNIVLANVASPTNVTADGAGITIRSDGLGGNKTIVYNAAANWFEVNQSININTVAGAALYINGSKVIDGTSLGSSITEIAGVDTFGKQLRVDIGPGSITDPAFIRLENNRISTLLLNKDLELEPDGSGNVALIGSPKITGLANPTLAQDAATKEYVDDSLQSRDIIFSMDLSDGKSDSWIIENILNGQSTAPLFLGQGLAEDPVTAVARGRTPRYRIGTRARILCTILSNSSTSLNINSLPPQITTSPFLTTTTGSTAQAVTGVSFPIAAISPSAITTTRRIKLFFINGSGSWSHQSDTDLPA